MTKFYVVLMTVGDEKRYQMKRTCWLMWTPNHSGVLVFHMLRIISLCQRWWMGGWMHK